MQCALRVKPLWTHLVDLELLLSGVFLSELSLPAALEVDGVHQHQSGQRVHIALGQQILDLLCDYKPTRQEFDVYY